MKLQDIRNGGWGSRVTVLAVIVCHLSLLLSPQVAAARAGNAARAATTIELERDPLLRAHKALKPALEELIDTHSRFFSLKRWTGGGTEVLQPLIEALGNADARIRADFAREQAHIAAHELPDTVREKHAQAQARYRARHDELMRRLKALRAGEDIVATARATLDSLHSLPLGRSHQPLDYAELPFGVSDGARTRPPLAVPEQLTAELPVPSIQAKSGINPNLAPGEDVQITPDIEALAAELGHAPVAIFNWVHDEIDYLPLYLSLQGSQRTLQTRRGNAFDIASLLIALLRASGIEARYRYGTVQIPEAQVRNWLGDLASAEAAISLLNQGGIPATGIIQGGQIKSIQLEHIWVEAHIDFYPSRGAIHRTPDAWVPLDAAFKQYEHTAGLPLAQDVPFDAQSFVDELLASAQIDEEAGTIEGIDTALIESRFETYLNDVNQYLDSQHPEATVGEVIGTRTIRPRQAPVLAATLPYALIAQGPQYSVLPDSLRGYYSYSLYASKQDKAYGNPLFTFRDSLPNLANARLALSFGPATEEDRATIESYLPEPDENGEIDPNDLPQSLPGYLIDLKAEFHRDGELVYSTGSFPMGTELTSTTAITRLTGGEITATNHPIAGEYHALGLNLPGGNGEDLQSIQARLATTQAALEAEQYDTLTKDKLVGDLLTATVNGYFAASAAQMELLNRSSDARLLMQPGYGAVNTVLEPQYQYGVPRQVQFAGLGIDVDAVAMSGAHSQNDNEQLVQIVQQMGSQLSAMEHRILEVLFTDENNPAEAASTVKALAKAAAEGQTIYTIDQSNLHLLDQVTATSLVKEDIRNGVETGLVATLHDAPISVGRWAGTGYSLIDPETGTGAYRISGGENGGYKDFAGIFSSLVGLMATFAGGLFQAAREAPIGAFAARLAAVAFFLQVLSISGRCAGTGNVTGPIIGAMMIAIFVSIFLPILISSGIGFIIINIVVNEIANNIISRDMEARGCL